MYLYLIVSTVVCEIGSGCSTPNDTGALLTRKFQIRKIGQPVCVLAVALRPVTYTAISLTNTPETA